MNHTHHQGHGHSHGHGHGHAENDNYNILFCTNINRHESPVRDYQQPFYKKEEQYKDYYGVSNFKFPEVTTVFRKNHANFCELSFDGTKSTKHHHRRNNSIKRVTSATTINCMTQAQVAIGGEEKCPNVEADQVIEKTNNNTTMTFQHLAEQFKRKLKFIEAPIKLNKKVVTKQKGSTFEVILSPKTPNSYSSIEAMSSILQSSEHHQRQIIVTSKTFHPPPGPDKGNGKPDMRDREIQTAIIGIRNINSMNECFNMGDIFYNMDLLPSNVNINVNEALVNSKRKKRKKLNLTMTHLPCVEIKCSSIIFEIPVASARRPQMPRRTINANNHSVIEDYHEASTASIDGKPPEPVAFNTSNSEATNNLKDKIFNLFNDTQMAASQDFTKKVNDLCALISSHLLDGKPTHDEHIKKSVKIPSEMFMNIRKLKASESSNRSNTNTLVIPSSSSQNRSRSVSPPSEPSTSSHVSRMSVVESNNEMNKINLTRSECGSNESKWKKKRFVGTSANTLSAGQKHSRFSFTSIPSVSTISSRSEDTKIALDAETDGTQTPQLGKTVPRNVFLIPPHVNEILKKIEYSPTSYLRNEFDEKYKSHPANNNNNNNNNTKRTSEFQLLNLKKTPIKQSWIVPDFVSKSRSKSESINNFQCTKITKSPKKSGNDLGGLSVTFNSMVDIFGGENVSLDLDERMRPTSDLKTLQKTFVPIGTGLKKSKTYPSKPELYAMSDRVESQIAENKQKVNFDKQTSFYNTGLLTTKKETNTTTSCLQKRKDYDNKLKMQIQMQNKQASKIPLPTKVVEQENETVKKSIIKSKLPLKITNEVMNNKQVIYRSNLKAFSKLLNTNIKDLPFSKLKSENTPRTQDSSQLSTPRPVSSILKSNQKYIENNLSVVTKDVTQ